jgi:hypothetical protein
MTKAKGIYSSWDVYHIQEGTERLTKAEEEVMKHIFETCIVDTKHLAEYLEAAREFRKNMLSNSRGIR